MISMKMENFNYGVVGNGRTAALISEKGSVDWFCLPDFDSPSVFAKLLDKEKGGCLGFIVGKSYQISQSYVEHTNILCTLFVDEKEGSFEVFDFMPLYKTMDKDKRYMPAELYRLIHVKSGSPRVRIDFSPKLNYARDEVSYILGNGFIKISSITNLKDTIYLYSDFDFHAILNKEEIVLTGEHNIMISYNQKLININMDRVRLEYSRTKVYWLNWSNRSKKYTKYGDYIDRSILVLKLLSYRRTGALLAAVTTSIPETIGSMRNWDYRYCWLRDASMSIQTLLKVGHRSSANSFMNFILNILCSKYDQIQIMYGIHGERKLTEKKLTYLSGFCGSKPVRIGNDAYIQKQNDSFGYLMDMIYYYFSTFQVPLDEIEDMFEVVKHLASIVMDEWRDEDSGIWEIRSKKAHFVSSKVMSWVALDRASKFAAMLHYSDYASIYAAEAQLIKNDVLKYGWKEEIQSFSQTYDNTNLDASLLLMEFYGFIDASDERYVKTVNAIYEKLSYKGLLFRYHNRDDFGIPSSSFTVCSFWMVRALFVINRKEEAQVLFDRLLSYSNHLKLFSEDIDFDTKTLLGNFPQAYSHMALIDTALLFTEETEVYSFLKP